jgi:hypothetical protein
VCSNPGSHLYPSASLLLIVGIAALAPATEAADLRLNAGLHKPNRGRDIAVLSYQF